MPGSSFGGGPAGCPLASGPVPGDGEDRGIQAGQGVIGAGGPVPAVPAAGVRGDVRPDEAEHGGERDKAGVEAGGSGGAGGRLRFAEREWFLEGGRHPLPILATGLSSV